MAVPPAIHGEPSWCLSNAGVDCAVTCRAGHVAPVVFHLEGRDFSPFALAPWTPDEIDPALPNLLKVLRGDFFCFPFGGSEEFPPHGVCANEDWTAVEVAPDRLEMTIGCAIEGAELGKVVSLREGQHSLYQEHRISGFEGRYNYGTHPILDFSNVPEGEGRVSVSPFRVGLVYPGLFSNPENDEYGALEPHGRFYDLTAVPLADGGTTDISRYPARAGFDDLVMMVSEPATSEQPFGWSAVAFDGCLWFTLKNVADFPATMFWMSNGGRRGAPWSGRHLGRLGIEDVCSHFSDGPDVARQDRLHEDRIPTTRHFTKDRPVSLRIVQSAVLWPSEFGAVTSIVPAGPGRVRITGETHQSVTAEVDWSYVL